MRESTNDLKLGFPPACWGGGWPTNRGSGHTSLKENTGVVAICSTVYPITDICGCIQRSCRCQLC